MQAQRYRHRVEVQQRVLAQDAVTGVISHTWATVELAGNIPLSSVPAEVFRGPGREFESADQKQAETTARIQFGWFPGLLPTMRLLWQDQPFDILSIETDATDRREYRVKCKEGLTDGS